MRLQRVLADAGVASRRECEQLILEGHVDVNGTTVTELPVFVNPMRDRITVDGRVVEKPKRNSKNVYVMLNKPDNTLGTTRDELEYAKGGRRTVTDLVEHPTGARLFPVGRLEYHATGLVLLTNDGELANRLTHASFGISKTYRVWLENPPTEDGLNQVRRRVGKREAVDDEGNNTGGVRMLIQVDKRELDRHPHLAHEPSRVLEIEVREGKTDPLEDVLVQSGCSVRKIARVAIGPLRMRGVKHGEWRDLSKSELAELLEAAGMGKAGGQGNKRKQRPTVKPRKESGPPGPKGGDTNAWD